MEKQTLSIPKFISLTVFALFCLGLIVWFSPIFSGKREYYEAKVKGKTTEVVFGNGKVVIKAEVEKTQKELAQGLSDRRELAQGYGMLFDLGSPSEYVSFWMNDMRFNLDMVWINKGKITGISRNVPFPKAHQKPVVIDSPGSVDFVLELVPGQTDSLQTGDLVSFR